MQAQENSATDYTTVGGTELPTLCASIDDDDPSLLIPRRTLLLPRMPTPRFRGDDTFTKTTT
jgi:hypothetical protein